MRIIHISDLHFGPHYRPIVGESLLQCIAQLQSEAVIITGDFTQRARLQEFKDAAEFLQKARLLALEVIVCPGNHDIALYRIWERLFYPFHRYRSYIHAYLNQVVDLPDVRVVSLNSVRPYSRLIEGKLNSRQLQMCELAFSSAHEKLYRVLALHHPVGMPLTVDERQREQRQKIAQVCAEQKIDLVLTGHAHESLVLAMSSDRCASKHQTLYVGCGTTTSGRGRKSEKEKNTLQLLEGDEKGIKISTFSYVSSSQTFEKSKMQVFPKDY